MRIELPKVAALFVLLILAGCGSKGDSVAGPNDDDDDDDDDDLPAVYLFSEEFWPTGGALGHNLDPAFQVPGTGKSWTVDVEVYSSNGGFGLRVPFDADDIESTGWGSSVLSRPQIDRITSLANSGNPTNLGDVLVMPSYSMFTPENQDYLFLSLKTQARFHSDAESRTRVLGLAFGGDEGGFVPVEPYAQDPFAGAQVWFKATKHPIYENWQMDQRDWRPGKNGAAYASAMRLVIREYAAVAIIPKAELAQLGVNRFRWDMYSYTDPEKDWSHDFTEWVEIEE